MSCHIDKIKFTYELFVGDVCSKMYISIIWSNYYICFYVAISILTNISSGASTMQKIPSVQGRWHPSSAAVVERVRKAATKSPAEGSLEFWGRRVLRPGQSHKNHSFSERLFFFFLADALNRCD